MFELEYLHGEKSIDPV